jgi:hypothetical protein
MLKLLKSNVKSIYNTTGVDVTQFGYVGNTYEQLINNINNNELIQIEEIDLYSNKPFISDNENFALFIACDDVTYNVELSRREISDIVEILEKNSSNNVNQTVEKLSKFLPEINS